MNSNKIKVQYTYH